MKKVLFFQPSCPKWQYCKLGTNIFFPFLLTSSTSWFYRKAYSERLLRWFFIFYMSYNYVELCNSHYFSKLIPCSWDESYPPGIYLLKVSNRNTRTRCEVCSELTTKTPERRHCRSGVFIVNFEHISHLVPVFLLLTLNM